MQSRVIQGFFVGGDRLAPPTAFSGATMVQGRQSLAAPPSFAFKPTIAMPVQRHTAPGRPAQVHIAPSIARPACANGTLQRFGGDGSFAIDPVQVGLVRSGGKPLPGALLAKMESALGADFSQVRVHVGPQASRIGALAFTTGNDLYFAPGQYQPDTVKGQQLIGHELAHVIQQRQGRVRAPGSGVTVVQDRALEAEADRLGMSAANHRDPPKVAVPLQRQTISFPIQRAQSIGERIRNRNQAGRTRSARLRGNFAFTGRTTYRRARIVGIWDESTRPGFTMTTWTALWHRGGSQTDANNTRLYTCVSCNNDFFRKKDAPRQNRALDATIDHTKNWKAFIFDNGAPNDEGLISKAAAKLAYNDINNLEIMCRSCNSSKNGPRNVFD